MSGKKKKKKGTNSKPAALSAESSTPTTAINWCSTVKSHVSNGHTTGFWSTAEECDHYANLGCHIANIARCHDANLNQTKWTEHGNRKKSDVTINDTKLSYNKMCKAALQQYPWILGIERFNPEDYDSSDIENIPEVAMNDGNETDDSDWEDCDEFIDNGDDTRSSFHESKIMTLTLTNVSADLTKICFVTVYDVDLCGNNGTTLQSGWTSMSFNNKLLTSEDSSAVEDLSATTLATKKRRCTTFIVLCPPLTFVHLCSLSSNQYIQDDTGDECSKKNLITSWSQVDIESDIQPWSYHENIDDEHSYVLHFPFHKLEEANSEKSTFLDFPNEAHNVTLESSNLLSLKSKVIEQPSKASYLCTQSENGQLTHFFHGNYHAIDFSCPIGTLLYSPINGIVVEINNCKKSDFDYPTENILEVSGIAASNLFFWNSIMLCADDTTDPLYVELVHIQSHSCFVSKGDRVRKGQILCMSGSVGFSPEPHLHLAAYRSNEDNAATVRVRFECAHGNDQNISRENKIDESLVTSFLPKAGGWYDEGGLINRHRITQ